MCSTTVWPYGIGMSFDINYEIGCDWDNAYAKGVIHTHSGIKCGDGKQLFVCVPNTDAPTAMTTQNPSVYPSIEPNVSVSPSTNPSNNPSIAPVTLSPTIIQVYSLPTNEPSALDETGLRDLPMRNGVSLSRIVYVLNIGNNVCDGLSE